jgi:hypothetical protein
MKQGEREGARSGRRFAGAPDLVAGASEATAHGFAYAVPATFTGIVGYGRGERSQADTIRVKVRVSPISAAATGKIARKVGF